MNNSFKVIKGGLVTPQKTDGVPIVSAKDVFTFGISTDLNGSIFDRPGKPSEAIKSTLYCMQTDFTWERMEQEIQKMNPVYYFQQEQVTEFCRMHAEELEPGTMTLFFVKEGDEIAVFTAIRMYGKKLTVYHDMVHRPTSHNEGVAAGFHIVIPD